MRISHFNAFTNTKAPARACSMTAAEPKDEVILSQRNALTSPLKVGEVALTMCGFASAALGVLSPVLAHPGGLATLMANHEALAYTSMGACFVGLLGGAGAAVAARQAGQFLSKQLPRLQVPCCCGRGR